jgi:signal transduction histidine kinase
MKAGSLTSRLIATMLCIEVALATFVTMAALYYERRETLRAFDVMLHGRADSVLGSVQDAEDAGDNVLLDKSSMHVPDRDIYEVREESGRFLGSSGQRQDELSSLLKDEAGKATAYDRQYEAHSVKIGRQRYRGIIMHGLRLIDPDEPGPAAGGKGTLHHIVIYYAAPTRPARDAVWRAARFFLLADAIALLLSVAAVAFLVRRGLQPLDALAAQATMLSPRSWNFEAPRSAYELSELAPLASALDVALRGLNQAYENQRTFVNDAAHELKTAVTVLKSSLQLLSFRDRTKIEYVTGIEGCLSDCGRMEELVQRMLLLARLEQSEPLRLQASSSRIAVGEMVRQVLAHFESAASLRGIVLLSEILDAREVEMSPEDCFTLLSNLVMNSLQHSPAGTTITVRCAADSASTMRVSVVDQGEGIAPEHLPRVFERFYRTDASRSRDTGGTGLGLAICKAIVESSGGSIQIESWTTDGTTVTFILPALAASTTETSDAVRLISSLR